ncbi:MAG: 2-polyprenyl-6-methoxyphenol hydroxylase-like FAD-dependent oxidoreductase, partial [Flavobacteriales bacterium]
MNIDIIGAGIGDSAHATTPNMGQGACQAIEDAFVLSEC